eukprot:tig00000455_g994.t1
MARPAAYEQLPALQPFERMLACPICRLGFTTPVSLSCGHSFCSLCIRRSLDHCGTANIPTCCPSCRNPTSVQDIRPNRTLDDLCAAYARCKGRIHAALESPAAPQLASAGSTAAADGPSSRSAATAKRKGPMDLFAKAVPPASAAPPATHAADKRPRLTTASPAPAASEVIDLEGDEDDVVVPRESAACAAQQPSEAEEKDEEQDAGVECGACGLRIASWAFPEHSGECLSTPAGREALLARLGASGDSAPPAERRHVPMPCFATLTEKQLRLKCRDAQLASNGDKTALTRRYREFVLRVQASGDARVPRPAAQLAREVSDMEEQREREERAARSRPEVARSQDDRFRALVEQVRARPRPAAAAAEGPAPQPG